MNEDLKEKPKKLISDVAPVAGDNDRSLEPAWSPDSTRPSFSALGSMDQDSSRPGLSPQANSSHPDPLQKTEQSSDFVVDYDDRLIGKTIGAHYEVLAKIGSGGMSTVYKARHLLLDKTVAIKFIKSRLVHEPQAVMRFQKEAKAATELHHENICSVKEFEIHDNDRAFLVMDFLEGLPLSEVIKKCGKLDAARAIKITSEICMGLGHAHKKAIIHRDIKPGNVVMVTDSSGVETVRIVDFGLAKLLREDQSGPNLTQTGEVFGTPNYMSPEQCLGKKVDQRSDIYSVGCVLYEMLYGKPPFAGDSSIEVIMQHVNEVPDLNGDTKIEEIVLKCLEKDPAKRFSSTDELLASINSEDVQREIESLGAGKALPVSKKKKRPASILEVPRTYVLAGIFVIVFGVSLAVIYESANLSRHTSLPADSDTDIASIDAKARLYFQNGQYERAADLLEFAMKAYRERMKVDYENKNTDKLLKDKTLFAEDSQHAAKCYFAMAEQARVNGETIRKEKYLKKSLNRYRDAMRFWMTYDYATLGGTSAGEAVSGYETLLKLMNHSYELNKLQAWVAGKK